MPAWTKVLRERAISGEEPLGVTRGLKPVHALLPLPGGLVRILRPIIQIPVLAMFYPGEKLSLGGSVALQFIGDDDARHVQQALEELAQEFLRGLLVPSALHQDIQDISVLIYRPPEIMPLAFDRQKHLIHMPLVTGPRTAATELIRIRLAKFATPFANGLIGHDDSAFKQDLFDITEAQTEPEVQPDGVADDFHGKAVILIVRGSWWCVHGQL